jgi:hypothetical protein
MISSLDDVVRDDVFRSTQDSGCVVIGEPERIDHQESLSKVKRNPVHCRCNE